MPTYVYRCKNCQHQFETIQSMKDEPLTKCPECEGVVSRLLFPPAISFKGTGFHVNDYPDTKSMVSGSSSASASKGTTPKSDS